MNSFTPGFRVFNPRPLRGKSPLILRCRMAAQDSWDAQTAPVEAPEVGFQPFGFVDAGTGAAEGFGTPPPVPQVRVRALACIA